MVALVDLDTEVRGDTVIYDLTLSRTGAVAGWMTGGTIVFMVKSRVSHADAAALITKTTVAAAGIVWVNQGAASPTATVTILPADWPAPDGRALSLTYEVEIIDASGRRETLQRGTLPVLADIVRGV